MGLGHRSRSALLAPVVATFALASVAVAQEHAGVVTTLQGRVTVARTSLPEPALLKFRDPVFVRDRIATGKESFARILLGGKAVVTVREFSTVTITEVPGVATVDVGSGRVAVAVARERMRPGDLVEVRTPNAVAGIRGTVIVAEVFDAQRSIITVLKGVIDVTRLDAGRAVGSSTVLNALQQVMINSAVSAPQPISSDAAQRMGAEFRTAPPSVAPKGATAAVTQAEVERVATDLAGVAAVSTLTAPVESSSGTGKTAQSDQPSGDSDKGKGSSSSGTATVSTGSGAAPASSASASAPAAAPAASAPAAAPAASAPAAASATSAPAAAPATSAPAAAPVANAPASAPAAAPVASAPASAPAPAPVASGPVAAAPVAISTPSALASTPTTLVNNTKSGKDKSGKKN
jgi:hypothetical protein